MAARGRGRGRGSASAFKPEQYGLSKNDLKSEQSSEPPPMFPPLLNKPLPFEIGEEQQYYVNVMEEFIEMWRSSPYYVKLPEANKDVERYSDKYPTDSEAAKDEKWPLDHSRYPAELNELPKKRSRSSTSNPRKLKVTSDLEKTFEALEKKETEKKDDEEMKSNASGEEEIDEEEVYDEAEEDEGADYGMSYFDNGEDYLDNDDDNLDDGPVY